MRYKSVDEMVQKTSPHSFNQFWKEQKERERKIRKAAGKHKCVKEEVGHYGLVNGSWKSVLYWCKKCHRDMGQKVITKKGKKK